MGTQKWRTMEEKRFGLSGSTLKIIAIITMLIDHIGAVLIPRLAWPGWERGSLFTTYQVMRGIGRLAFPIFCFLLVEGFFHTRCRVKYVLRLLLFAFISEIPFDLAFLGASFEPGPDNVFTNLFKNGLNNVFFTLSAGLAMMMAFEYFKDKKQNCTHKGTGFFFTAVQLLVLLLASAAALLMNSDYNIYGIIAIAGMYFLHGSRGKMCVVEAVFFYSFEPPAIFSFIPIWLYNGKRGLKMKYIFYIFYPGHLLLLYALGNQFPVY